MQPRSRFVGVTREGKFYAFWSPESVRGMRFARILIAAEYVAQMMLRNNPDLFALLLEEGGYLENLADAVERRGDD